MNALVCGGRDFTNAHLMNEVLDGIHAATIISLVIHGGARGTDTLAGTWALWHGVDVQCYPAEWEVYGRAAGFVRNQYMLDVSLPDLVVAFPGGRGTADMVRRARASGVPVVFVGNIPYLRGGVTWAG